ncbi:MAG: hypothetical protein NTW59_02820 [Candidatus Diapherotrites archaeon]|nr:hypothetical protein [Candidatus Diapherotrites archaeon]
MESTESRLNGFLKEKRLSLARKLAKGWSSEIFLVRNSKGKKFVAKVEREKSKRWRMAEREAENLTLANSAGVGPKLAGFDLEKRVILMGFVEGKTFSEWLFSGPKKKQLQSFVRELLKQAKALDKIGLDHGQLAGKGANILVHMRKGKALPVIIDFEKASAARKCHNAAVIEAFLFRNPHGAVAKKVKELLWKEEIEKVTS